jgi:hypothetical protein
MTIKWTIYNNLIFIQHAIFKKVIYILTCRAIETDFTRHHRSASRTSASRSSPRDRLGPETGPDQVRGPGPSDSLEERPEKTAVLGPVRTGPGPNQDGRRVALNFI